MNKWEKLQEILGEQAQIVRAKHGRSKTNPFEKRLWRLLKEKAKEGKMLYGRLASITKDTYSPNEIWELLEDGKEVHGFKMIYKDNIGLAVGNGKRIVAINIPQEKFEKALEIESKE